MIAEGRTIWEEGEGSRREEGWGGERGKRVKRLSVITCVHENSIVKPTTLYANFIFIYCMSMHHVHIGTCEGQRRALGPLKLELWVVVSRVTMWLLETEPRSSARAVSDLHC